MGLERMNIYEKSGDGFYNRKAFITYSAVLLAAFNDQYASAVL